MRTKSTFLRHVLVLAMLLVPSACDASDREAQKNAAVQAAPSRTGALLGALVAIRRHETSQADRALVTALQLGAPAPLRDIALLYALSDPEPKGPEIVSLLSAQQPNMPLSRFATGTNALAHANWTAARAQFTPLLRKPRSVFKDLAGGLVALTWYADNRRADASSLLNKQRITSGTWLEHLLLLRLLARDDPRNPELNAMFHQTARQIDDAPTLIQIWFVQFEAAWLAANGHEQSAVAMLSRLRQHPQTRLMAARMTSQQFDLHPSIKSLAGELITLFVSALSNATSLAEAGHHGQNIEPDTLQIAKRYQEAMLNRALFLDSKLSLARLELARLQRKEGQLDAARKTLSLINDQDVYAIAASAQRFDIALQEQDTSGALQYIKSLNAAFPHDIDLLTMRASLELELNRLGPALKHSDQASRQLASSDRRLGEVLYCRGTVYDRLGQPKAAQEDFGRALLLDPDQPGLLNNIGYRGILQSDAPESALKLIARAHKLSPVNVEVNDSYGWGLLVVNGDVKAALPLLTKAIEMRPDDPEIGYHLGVAYWYHGMATEARTEWRRALMNKPDVSLHDALLEALDGNPPPLGDHRAGGSHPRTASTKKKQSPQKERPQSL